MTFNTAIERLILDLKVQIRMRIIKPKIKLTTPSEVNSNFPHVSIQTGSKLFKL